MFPRLRQRLGSAALDRLDGLIELSTLGEYGLGEDGRPLALAEAALEDSGASVASGAGQATRLGRPPRLRDECPLGGRAIPRSCDVPAAP